MDGIQAPKSWPAIAQMNGIYDLFTKAGETPAACLSVDLADQECGLLALNGDFAAHAPTNTRAAIAALDGSTQRRPSPMPRIILWALVPVLVSLCGCAIPPAVTIISIAANAVSFAATGKSVTDHGISAVVGEDCALWRVVADRKICTDDSAGPGRPVVADAEPELPKVPTLAEASIDQQPSLRAQEPAAEPEARRFLVLGSFINQDNAAHLVASLDGVETAIVTVGMGGATFHRVVAGPLDDTGVNTLRERMALEARVRPWEITEPAGRAHSVGTAVATPPKTRDMTALPVTPG